VLKPRHQALRKENVSRKEEQRTKAKKRDRAQNQTGQRRKKQLGKNTEKNRVHRKNIHSGGQG